MAELIVDGDELVVRLRAVERMEAVHGEVRVPLGSVRTVEVLDDAWSGPRASRRYRHSRSVGHRHLQIPRGQDLRRGSSRHPTRCRVDLEGAQFDQLIVGCDDPKQPPPPARQPG